MCERTVATLNHAKTLVNITDGCRHLKSTPSYIHFSTYIAETKRKYLGLGGFWGSEEVQHAGGAARRRVDYRIWRTEVEHGRR
jgi:hypothetical protein